MTDAPRAPPPITGAWKQWADHHSAGSCVHVRRARGRGSPVDNGHSGSISDDWRRKLRSAGLIETEHRTDGKIHFLPCNVTFRLIINVQTLNKHLIFIYLMLNKHQINLLYIKYLLKVTLICMLAWERSYWSTKAFYYHYYYFFETNISKCYSS